MKLAYQGFTRTGQAVADVLDAPSLPDATEQLRRKGLFVTRIAPADGIAPPPLSAARSQRDAHADAAIPTAPAHASPASSTRSNHSRRSWSKPSLRGLAFLTRQLAVMVSTGTPLVQSLAAVERQIVEPAWKRVIGKLRGQVEQGVPLARAMEEQSDVFDPVCRAVIAAGEASGKIRPMLERLADMTRRRLRVRNTTISTLTYPALLISIASTVLMSMLLFVLPKFTELFKNLDTPLPLTTKVMVLASDFIRANYLLVVPATIAALAASAWWVRTPRGRYVLATAALNAPVVGPIIRSFITARAVRVLGLLIEAKVQLLDALDLTGQAADNPHYQRLIDRAKDSVTRGESVSSAFRGSPLVPPALVEAMSTGEQTGQLAQVMLLMADTLDEDNELVVKSLASLLEPVLLLFLGMIVGLVALSLFMPLLDLTAAAQGGA